MQTLENCSEWNQPVWLLTKAYQIWFGTVNLKMMSIGRNAV